VKICRTAAGNRSRQ